MYYNNNFNNKIDTLNTICYQNNLCSIEIIMSINWTQFKYKKLT